MTNPEPTVPPSARRRYDVPILIGLTLVAAVVRFARLSHPPFLPDDAFTFWRVCGSFRQMVETLRDDGFPPLHYELLWWIKEGGPLPFGWRVVPGGFYLSPVVMRFVPAVCGTLMPAATYFLGRQLLTRRASLVAAGLAATSAYLSWFSRDAKMYMPLWLLTTLCVGCLLWWRRAGTPTAWLCWVATGLAAVGNQMIAMLVIVALTPLVALTGGRRRWTTIALAALGLAVIGAGPAGYYVGFNQWSERSGGVLPGATPGLKPGADWETSGLGWIGTRPDQPMVLAGTVSTWLTCFELRPGMWSQAFDGNDNDDDGNRRYPGYIARIAWWCGMTLLVTGAFMAIGSMPWSRRALGYARDDMAPQPAWWVALWLGSWVGLVVYGFFYCRSLDEPASPAALFRHIETPALVGGWAAMVGVFAWRRRDDRRAVLTSAARLLAAVVVVVVLCWVAWGAMEVLREMARRRHPEVEWETIWHTRYVAIVWPAVVLIVAGLLDRVPTWPLRTVAVGLLVAANLTSALARVTQDSQYRFDLVWADIWAARPGGDVRTYVDLGLGAGGPLPQTPYWRMVNAYYGVYTGRVPTSPPDFRVGKTWPFVYGPVFNRIRERVMIRPYADDARVLADLADAPEVRHVVVWRPDSRGPLVLDGFQPVRETTHVARWAWTWSEQGSLIRFEFVR